MSFGDKVWMSVDAKTGSVSFFGIDYSTRDMKIVHISLPQYLNVDPRPIIVVRLGSGSYGSGMGMREYAPVRFLVLRVLKGDEPGQYYVQEIVEFDMRQKPETGIDLERWDLAIAEKESANAETSTEGKEAPEAKGRKS